MGDQREEAAVVLRQEPFLPRASLVGGTEELSMVIPPEARLPLDYQPRRVTIVLVYQTESYHSISVSA